MNKELWGKTTDLPSDFVTHFSTPWKKKKTLRQSAGCIIQSTQPRMNLHTKPQFLSTFHFSLFPDFLFSFWFPRALALLPFLPFIYILFSISAVFLLFFYLFFPLLSLALVLKGGPEALGTQRHGTGTHTKTQLAHKSSTDGAMQRASYNRDPLLRR